MGFDWSSVAGVADSLFGGLFGLGQQGMANQSNRELALQNLIYQQQRNQIEDERYADETQYNRAFAEDERDYQRALQQQIFEREDTAIERQVNQLSKMGINPLSQGGLNGLGAGSPVSSATPPTESARGGQALHNDFKFDNSALDMMISPLMNLSAKMNELKTGEVSRDALQSERDGQILENQSKAIDNLIKASENDVSINSDGTVSLNRQFTKKKQDFNEVDYANQNASKNRNVREDYVQETYGSHDNMNNMAQIATDTAYNADRALKYSKNKIDTAVNDVISPTAKVMKDAAQAKLNEYSESIKDYAKNTGEKIKSGAKSAGKKIKAGASKVGNSIKNGWNYLWNR